MFKIVQEVLNFLAFFVISRVIYYVHRCEDSSGLWNASGVEILLVYINIMIRCFGVALEELSRLNSFTLTKPSPLDLNPPSLTH